MPASGGRQRRTIGVEDAIVQMAGVVNAEYRTAAALRAQKGQIARNDAVVDAEREWRTEEKFANRSRSDNCPECRSC